MAVRSLSFILRISMITRTSIVTLAYLVDGCPVALLHLVKLVDAADATVGQDEGTSLQDKLLGHLWEVVWRMGV